MAQSLDGALTARKQTLQSNLTSLIHRAYQNKHRPKQQSVKLDLVVTIQLTPDLLDFRVKYAHVQ
ncbi:MAG: hypothetical protein R8M38_07170 [Mariprofundaceae bacterium]